MKVLRSLRWVLAPFWGLELFTGGKSFLPNPILIRPWLNACGLHLLRVSVAQRMVAWRRRRLAGLVSDEDRHAFARDGFLTAAEALRIAHVKLRSFSGPGNRLVVGDTVGFHARGESRHPSTRIEIWAYCRPNPFSPFLGIDWYVHRPLREWRAAWRWQVIGWIERFGMQGILKIPEDNMWRKAGRVGLATPYRRLD